ncbi:hypothetical protein CCAX7_46520 [Capsulimonas corticalis]|uniref:Uncharacterized protein n=1 Tax=Capsulimonas corticalis TaxID=2219043 RepID=A0A402D506_9BACT|nr:hypothetical protein [Capsulimonas corticalis]BDI32601.1 hypothetical protein CCAX7_46520 [Capsulimonas corticalis]
MQSDTVYNQRLANMILTLATERINECNRFQNDAAHDPVLKMLCHVTAIHMKLATDYAGAPAIRDECIQPLVNATLTHLLKDLHP